MSSSVSQAFHALKLSDVENDSDYKNIFDVSYRYLKDVKQFKDFESLHNCLVSLINLDKYEKALGLLKQVPDDVHKDLYVEKAYLYYKLGKSDELSSLLENFKANEKNIANPKTERALRHIAAQNYYREGKNLEALYRYQELIRSNNDTDASLELACNERAVIYQLKVMNHIEEKPLIASTIQESYDILFNDALINVCHGNHSVALFLLEQAQEKCLSQNSHLLESELLIELVPIKLAISYIYQVTKKADVALELIEDIMSKHLPDPILAMLIRNNYYALKKPVNVNENLIARDIFEQFNSTSVQLKLSKPQYGSLLNNQLLLALYSGSLSKTSSYLKPQFLKYWSQIFTGDLSLLLYKTMLKLEIEVDDLINSTKHKLTSRKLYQFITTNPQQDDDCLVPAAFLLFTVNCRQEHFDQSIVCLERLVDHQIRSTRPLPSLCGLLINLYDDLNLSHKLHLLFLQLSKMFIDDSTHESVSNSDIEFIKVVGFKLLAFGDDDKARGVLDIVRRMTKEDSVVAAVFDSPESLLTPVSKLTAGIPSIEDLLQTDVSDLMSTGVSQPLRFYKPPLPKKVHKRHKKPRFSSSKNVIPDAEFDSNSLDSERWFPLKLRSYYKPSKKENKKKSFTSHASASTSGHTGSSKASSLKSKKKK